MERLRFPPHDLVIDEERFRTLLKSSLSLMPAEKKRILEAVPEMTQKRFDAIIGAKYSHVFDIDFKDFRGERIYHHGRIPGADSGS